MSRQSAEVSPRFPVWAAGVGTDQYGMGMAVGDFDADGDFDWFVTSIHGSLDGDGNRLYRYDGNRRFTDDMSLLWRNLGGGILAQVNSLEGITDRKVATGTLSFDYDNDGDLDLLVINNGDKPILYRNNGSEEVSWLEIKAVGTRSNRDAVGAIIRLRANDSDPPLLRFVDGGTNFLAQNERRVHFGLGESTGLIDEIEVTWPSGRVQILNDVSPNQVLTITEPSPHLLAFTKLSIQHGRAYATWNCQPGSNCLLEISDDLQSWRKAALIKARGSTMSWTDPERSLPEKRYYHAWR